MLILVKIHFSLAILGNLGPVSKRQCLQHIQFYPSHSHCMLNYCWSNHSQSHMNAWHKNAPSLERCFMQALAMVEKPELLEGLCVEFLCNTPVVTNELNSLCESTPWRNKKRTFKECGYWELWPIKKKVHYEVKRKRNILEMNSFRAITNAWDFHQDGRLFDKYLCWKCKLSWLAIYGECEWVC